MKKVMVNFSKDCNKCFWMQIGCFIGSLVLGFLGLILRGRYQRYNGAMIMIDSIIDNDEGGVPITRGDEDYILKAERRQNENN